MSDFRVLVIGGYVGEMRRVPTWIKEGALFRLAEPHVNRLVVCKEMVSALRNAGLAAEISRVSISSLYYDRAIQLLRAELRSSPLPTHFVCFSMGGVLALGCALSRDRDKVRGIIAVSTPVWGTTNPKTNRHVRRRTGISKDLFISRQQKIQALDKPIDLAVSHGDELAPPEKCYFERQNGELLEVEETGHHDMFQDREVLDFVTGRLTDTPIEGPAE